MRTRKSIYDIRCGLLSAAMFSFLLLVGCSDESAFESLESPVTVEEEEGQSVTVPISVSLVTGWEMDTRAVPPGAGGNGNSSSGGEEETTTDDGIEELKDVDEVQIFTFRRRVDENRPEVTTLTEEDYKTFEYDPSNHYYLHEEKEEGSLDDKFGDSPLHTKNHKVFKGSLKKVKGWEYKVIAVAYSKTAPSSFKKSNGDNIFGSEDGDISRVEFDHSGLTLDKFVAKIQANLQDQRSGDWGKFCGWNGVSVYYGNTAVSPYYSEILNNYVCQPPQLFYGDCYTELNGTRSNVIHFYETDSSGENNSTLGLQGVLYRGLAKIEVYVKEYPNYSVALGMLQFDSYPMTAISLLADNVYTNVGLRNYDDFKEGSISIVSPIPKRDSDRGVFSAICYSEVSDGDIVNSTYKTKVLEAYILPCKTRLLIRAHYNKGTINAYRNGWLNHDDLDWKDAVNGTGIVSPDSHDGRFYIRRNHKYVITIDNLGTFMDKAKDLPKKLPLASD